MKIEINNNANLRLEFLHIFCGCHADSEGNMPCDNGVLCDKCCTKEAEDYWKKFQLEHNYKMRGIARSLFALDALTKRYSDREKVLRYQAEKTETDELNMDRFADCVTFLNYLGAKTEMYLRKQDLRCVDFSEEEYRLLTEHFKWLDEMNEEGISDADTIESLIWNDVFYGWYQFEEDAGEVTDIDNWVLGQVLHEVSTIWNTLWDAHTSIDMVEGRTELAEVMCEEVEYLGMLHKLIALHCYKLRLYAGKMEEPAGKTYCEMVDYLEDAWEIPDHKLDKQTYEQFADWLKDSYQGW